MDRGVIVGGGLIAASFLVAILLNRSAHEERVPEREPPARACAQAGARPTGSGPLPDSGGGECERSRPDPLQR